MKYPRQITVFGNKVKIRFVDEMPYKNALGYFDMNNDEIVIDNSLGDKMRFEVFMHEVLHAFDEYGSLKLKHRNIYVLPEIILFILDKVGIKWKKR